MSIKIPKDPMILYSFINMKLRDNYFSLEKLCEDLEIEQNELEERLNSVGFVYNRESNKFF